MRAIIVLSLSAFVLVGCGEQAEEAPVVEQPVAEQPAAPESAAEVMIVPPAEVPARLVGTWTSIDDAQASIVITADGTWADIYAAESVNETFSWRAINGVEAAIAAPDHTFTPTATYLEVKRPEAVYFYELGHVSADDFEMFYVGRGNRLAFTRAK
jgi:hypothetical protein